MSAIDQLLGLEPAPASDWPLPKQHLSMSAVTRYAKCPEQYRWIYVLGERRPPGAALVWGRADHKAHEANFAQKIESYEDLSVSDMEFIFADAFEAEVDEAGGRDEVQWDDDKPTEVFERGRKLVTAYHQKVSPQIQPLSVEQRFEITVPKIPVPVIGYTDIRTADRLIDGKTSGQKVKKPKPDWVAQAAIYQLANPLPIEFHVKTKTKLPAVYTAADEQGLLVPYNPVALDAQTRLIQMLVADLLHNYQTYGPNEPWPTTAPFASDWACLPKWCGFRPICAWWRT